MGVRLGVEALLATERRDEAQSFRWSCFERRLDTSHLRAYLKALPDFDDVLAEENALNHALSVRLNRPEISGGYFV